MTVAAVAFRQSETGSDRTGQYEVCLCRTNTFDHPKGFMSVRLDGVQVIPSKTHRGAQCSRQTFEGNPWILVQRSSFLDNTVNLQGKPINWSTSDSSTSSPQNGLCSLTLGENRHVLQRRGIRRPRDGSAEKRDPPFSPPSSGTPPIPSSH
ncbi:unnamed protein product [Pleuronectes platessa]|uniref:Uncharacterized protein n=1 Tax=Pleuronectes platessa TaxID=8262 RepID=A0A9N7V659_PLEPL|nr:unnamed protein product [Pleuronectes platessa]